VASAVLELPSDQAKETEVSAYVDPRHPFEITHDLCSYTFPLSNGDEAQLILPRVVTEDDARRLAEFIRCVCAGKAIEAGA
jgi:hypothetical protein